MRELLRFAARYDEHHKVFLDCPWCFGRSCLACPDEADKAYQRLFPNGPMPEEIRDRGDPNNVGLIDSILARLRGTR